MDEIRWATVLISTDDGESGTDQWLSWNMPAGVSLGALAP